MWNWLLHRGFNNVERLWENLCNLCQIFRTSCVGICLLCLAQWHFSSANACWFNKLKLFLLTVAMQSPVQKYCPVHQCVLCSDFVVFIVFNGFGWTSPIRKGQSQWREITVCWIWTCFLDRNILAVRVQMFLHSCVYITLQVNILILISFLEKFGIHYRQGTLQAACPEASIPRNPGCTTLEMFVFSCIGRLRWNAVCSFLPVSLSGTTLNPDLTSAHRLLSTVLTGFWF